MKKGAGEPNAANAMMNTQINLASMLPP